MVKIRIIGSSHIAKGSVNKIKKEITEKKPDIVAVELDEVRVHSLFNKQETKIDFSNVKRLGMTRNIRE